MRAGPTRRGTHRAAGRQRAGTRPQGRVVPGRQPPLLGFGAQRHFSSTLSSLDSSHQLLLELFLQKSLDRKKVAKGRDKRDDSTACN